MGIGTIADFTKEIQDFITNSKAAQQAVIKEAVLEIGRELVAYSPVGKPAIWKNQAWANWKIKQGYTPGLFVNSWQVGIDSPPADFDSTPDPMGESSLERLSHLGRWQIGHTYYFANYAKGENGHEYGEELEMGHSTQCPPQGMIGRVETNFQTIINNAAQAVNETFQWNGKGFL